MGARLHAAVAGFFTTKMIRNDIVVYFVERFSLAWMVGRVVHLNRCRGALSARDDGMTGEPGHPPRLLMGRLDGSFDTSVTSRPLFFFYVLGLLTREPCILADCPDDARETQRRRFGVDWGDE